MALRVVRELDEVRIGYLAMHWYRPLAGVQEAVTRDNRQIQQDHVLALLADFKADGVKNCLSTTVIHVVASPSHFNSTAAVASIDDKSIIDLPLLDVTPEGKISIQQGHWKFQGGQHRFYALELLLSEKENELLDAQTKLEKLQAKHKMASKDLKDAKLLQEAIAKITKSIAVQSLWAICIYDKGELGLSIYFCDYVILRY